MLRPRPPGTSFGDTYLKLERGHVPLVHVPFLSAHGFPVLLANQNGDTYLWYMSPRVLPDDEQSEGKHVGLEEDEEAHQGGQGQAVEKDIA